MKKDAKKFAEPVLNFFPHIVHQDSGVSQRLSPIVVHHPDPNQNTFHESKKKIPLRWRILTDNCGGINLKTRTRGLEHREKYRT